MRFAFRRLPDSLPEDVQSAVESTREEMRRLREELAKAEMLAVCLQSSLQRLEDAVCEELETEP